MWEKIKNYFRRPEPVKPLVLEAPKVEIKEDPNAKVQVTLEKYLAEVVDLQNKLNDTIKEREAAAEELKAKADELEAAKRKFIEEQTAKTISFGGQDRGPVKVTKPNGTFRQGMWAVKDKQIGILNEFKGEDVMFHHVDMETGWTTKEEQISLLRVRQALYDEIPPCRRGFTREDAYKLGYF